jgi:uncharacterized lipoprotein YmbA
MTRLPFAIGLALLAVMLTACGTSPPVRYFSLEPAAVSATVDEPGARVVGLGPLRVPDYLKRSQIVTRGSGSEIKVNDYARWAEPVDKAMHRVLAANVDRQLEGVIVVAYPYLETVPVDYIVLGQVDRFDGDSAGSVVLEVQWSVQNDQRKALISPQRVRYETRASDPDDPEAITRAMNQALARFSDDIARKLDTTLREPPASE